MSTIQKIQEWYKSQCDGDWEHMYGVKIETLDNPGWHVIIDLTNTGWEAAPFPHLEHGIGKDAEPEGCDWIICNRIDNIFHGYGGPDKLEEILNHFLEWVTTPQI